MTTNSNAHVCTPRLVPVIGEMLLVGDEIDIDALKARWGQSFAPFRQPILEGINLVAGGHEQPPTNWPGQRLMTLPPMPRTHDATAKFHQCRHTSDFYHYKTDDGRLAAAAYRHSGEKHQKWHCQLIISDNTGAEWFRSFPGVTDDFGWLVEVPAC